MMMIAPTGATTNIFDSTLTLLLLSQELMISHKGQEKQENVNTTSPASPALCG